MVVVVVVVVGFMVVVGCVVGGIVVVAFLMPIRSLKFCGKSKKSQTQTEIPRFFSFLIVL